MDQTDTPLDISPVVKKRGRPKNISGDVSRPKKPKTPKHKTYSKPREKKQDLPEVDWEQFEKLCGYQCTQEEISDFFRLEEEQLIQMAVRKYKKPFERIYKIFSAPGLCSLRRSQFLLSKNNSTMAIWLGKLYLGQVDPALTRTEETVDRLSSILEEIDEGTKRILSQSEDLHGSIF